MRGDGEARRRRIDAFYTGMTASIPAPSSTFAKLDLDLGPPAGYFADLMDRMEAEPRIGTCSGKPYFVQPGAPDADVQFPLTDSAIWSPRRPATRTRRDDQVLTAPPASARSAGSVRELMWDGIDGHRCRPARVDRHLVGRPALRSSTARWAPATRTVDRPGCGTGSVNTSWAPPRCTCWPARLTA